METRENDALFRDLTERMSNGDEHAYGQFYERCFDRIYRHLLVRTRGNESLAQEVAQLVLVRVARYIKPLPGERAFWSWIWQACRSAHVDWLRQNARCVPEDLWQEPPAQEAAIEAGQNAEEELLQRLESSIETLESSERELLRLAYFEAVPHREIAQQMCSTSKAVESKLARIRRKLREILIQKLNEYALF